MKVTSSEDLPQSDSSECRRGAAAALRRSGIALQGAQVCERGIPDRHPNVSRVQRGACYLIPIHKGLDMEFARFSGRIFVLLATLLASAALAAAPVSAATTPDKAKHAHDAAKPKKSRSATAAARRGPASTGARNALRAARLRLQQRLLIQRTRTEDSSPAVAKFPRT
jgi:hypothetical protein